MKPFSLSNYKPAGVLTATTILATLPLVPMEVQAQTIQPSLGNNASYTLSETAGTGGGIVSTYIHDAVNKNTTKSNQIVGLKNNVYGTGANSLTINTIASPNNGLYTIVAKYGDVSTTRISTTPLGDIVNENFVGLSYSRWDYVNGGAIGYPSEYQNDKTGVTGNVSGNFIRNTIRSENSTAYGGALYANKIGNIEGNFIENAAYGKSTATGGGITIDGSKDVGHIKGNFIGNSAISEASAFSGGAIEIGRFNKINPSGGNHDTDIRPNIEYIEGSFVGNFGKGIIGGNGGAIDFAGDVGEIRADFISNAAISTSRGTSNGGAIYSFCSSSIGSIIGDFIANYADGGSTGSAYGGALYVKGALRDWHTAKIGDITSHFIGNYAKTQTGTVSGGAIFNAGEINSIKGTFQGNYAAANSGAAKGGAIYNEGTIGELIDTSFYNNYAFGKGTNETFALGGAIYSKTDLNIIADTVDTIFSGNYAQIGGGAIRRQAIYMEGVNTDITLNARGADITFDDKINGVNYGLILTGKDTATITLNAPVINAKATLDNVTLKMSENTFQNSALTANSGKVHVLNNIIENYAINKLASNANVKYYIDVNVGNMGYVAADKFVLSDRASSGTVFIEDINWLNNIKPQVEFKAQVLDTKGSNAIQLALSDTLKNTEYYIGKDSETLDDLKGTINWSGKFHDIIKSGDKYGKLVLDKTQTDNDSIALKHTNTVWNDKDTKVVEKDYTLSELNKYELKSTEPSKNFNADSFDQTYDVRNDLGASTEGVFNINGTSKNENEKSTLVLGNHKGFVLDKNTELNINNSKLTGNDFITVTNKDAVVTLNNSHLQSSTTDGTIVSGANHLNITGTGTITNLNGNVKDTHATLTDATLKFNENTFKDSNSSLDAQSGRIRTVNNTIENFNVNKLTSTDKTMYTIDVNASNNTADKFTLTDKSSSGTVYIDIVNFINDARDIDADFKAQVLDTNGNDSIQISLSDEIKNEIFGREPFGSSHDDLRGTIGWGEKFHDIYEGGVRYYTLAEGTTNTTNDSIVSVVHESHEAETVLERANTLTELIKYELKPDEDSKNFNAASANDVYATRADLGSMTEGVFNINGVSKSDTEKSTLLIGNHQGFILDKETTFNINDTKIAGSNPLITVTNSDAVINLNNSYIAGNITGEKEFQLNVTGKNTTTILEGIITKANATLTDATLKLGVTNPNSGTSDVLRYSTLNAVSGEVNTKDGAFTNYYIGELNSNKDVAYEIDMKLNRTEQKADTFTVGENSTGIIKLAAINAVNDCKFGEKYILQIVKSENKSANAPQITWDGAKILEGAKAVMSTDDELKAGIGLYSKDTLNDSIIIRGDLDVLAEWAELETKDDKQFTFNEDYKLSVPVSSLGGENLEIIGNDHTLDAGHNGLLQNIKEGQNVKISDLNIENSSIVVNKGGLDLSNVNLPVNIDNKGTLTLEGETKVGNIVNDKTLNINNMHTDLVNNIRGTEGTVNVNNSDIKQYGIIDGQNVIFNNSTAVLNNPSGYINSGITLNNSSLDIPVLGVNSLNLQTFGMTNGNITIGTVDVDLHTQQMGHITAENYGDNNGKITINNLNIKNESKDMYTEIKFTDSKFADKVDYKGQNEYYSALSKYEVSYLDENGHFRFAKVNTGKGFSGYNPAVFAGPVASQVGAFSALNQTTNYAFEHSDVFMPNPVEYRTNAMKGNLYSISEAVLPYQTNQYKDFSTWIRPYATFEDIPLKNGPKVGTISYGTLVGMNGNMSEIGKGWYAVPTMYLAYNGSTQNYSGINTNQNGGILGVTETLYKNNFFTAITVNAGGMVGQSSTMYGSDDFVNIMAGIASKTGYNMEFKEGKIIIQPSAMISYSFVDTLSYRSVSGLKVDSNPFHTIQLHPNIKFIANTKTGWQPYMNVGMVWNINNRTQVTVADTLLPELSIKPYVEYGLGLQKRVKDDFTAFGQAMVRNGGRNGVALNFGFHWAVGKRKKPIEHVEKHPEPTENKIERT